MAAHDSLEDVDVARGIGDEWTCWPAPAKLNLFLHIVGRRADGYHLLQTAFQLLDWGDEVRLRPRADGAIRRLDPLPGVAEQADLAVRAALALQAATGCRLGVDIAVEKRVPIGGGLGGGSSDAATTLVALNAIWGTGVDEDELADIATGLGADVPVFVRGKSAWAEGIGDRLVPLALPERWYAVVDPGVGVSTRELFQVPELTRNSPSVKMDVFSEGYGCNDLEKVASARFPEIIEALEYLRARSPAARMTGSGSCVFAPFAHEAEACAAVAAKPPQMRGFVARTLARHPLAEFAQG
jgi:4-diphosphocytidyl-2-C-methyl-D-erythritol kinase